MRCEITHSNIGDALRLTAAGMSSRNIAASWTTTVIDYLQGARRAGLGCPLPD